MTLFYRYGLGKFTVKQTKRLDILSKSYIFFIIN